MKLLVRWNKLKQTPLRMIEWIIVIQTILGGLYILSPLVEKLAMTIVKPSIVAQVVISPIGILALGSIFLFSAILLAAGLIWEKKQWRATGLFINICVRIYGLVGGWALNGFMPPSWLASATLLSILIVIYFHIKREQSNGSSA